MNKNEIVEAFLAYDMGEVEFMELMLEKGASRGEINAYLIERRSDEEEL